MVGSRSGRGSQPGRRARVLGAAGAGLVRLVYDGRRVRWLARRTGVLSRASGGGTPDLTTPVRSVAKSGVGTPPAEENCSIMKARLSEVDDSRRRLSPHHRQLNAACQESLPAPWPVPHKGRFGFD
jgi:hypothetical protein